MVFLSDWMCPTVVEVFGLLFLAHWLLYKPLKAKISFLANNCLACSTSKKILKPTANDFAVVTGATDGIGLEYAKQLAEKGFNLVLLSRTEEKLKRVSEEIQKLYPQCREIQIIPVDFSQVDIYERIQRKLVNLNGPVKILVNNVGIMNPVPEYFAAFSEGYHLRMINVNVISMTAMSEMVLHLMMGNDKIDRKKGQIRGVIINISSSVAAKPYPLFATYSASKAYLNYLGKALSTEYTSEGILIQTVTPGMVATGLSAKMQANMGSFLAVSAESFVRYALQTVGSEQQTNGHPKHKLLSNCMSLVAGLLGESLTQKLLLASNKRIKANSEKKIQPITMENPMAEEEGFSV